MEENQIIKQIGKTQFIRIIDFTVLGPGLVLYGAVKKKASPLERILFIAIGASTTAYNFYNWKIQKEIIENSGNS